MKNSISLILILSCSLAFYSCDFAHDVRNEDQTEEIEFISVHPDLRPLLHDVGSKWVYQDRSGHRDSAIIIGIDSNVTRFTAEDDRFIDMEVIEVSYSPNEIIGDKQIFRSNYITANYKNGPLPGEISFIWVKG